MKQRSFGLPTFLSSHLFILCIVIDYSTYEQCWHDASCADPDSFVRGGNTLTTFSFLFFSFDEGRGSK